MGPANRGPDARNRGGQINVRKAEPKRFMSINGAMNKWATAIGAGLLIVLQGVNLHSTGEIGRETISAEQHVSAELTEIRKLQIEIDDGLKGQQILIKNQQSGLHNLETLVEENKRMADEIRNLIKK